MDLEPKYPNLSRKIGLGVGLLVALFYFCVRGAGLNLSWPVIGVLIAAAGTTILYWHLHLKVWLWLTIGTMTGVQLILLSTVALPDVDMLAPVLVALSFLDLALFVGCIKLVGRRLERRAG